MQIQMTQPARLVIAVIVYILFSSKMVLAQSVPVNQLVLPSETSVIPFRWQGDSINGTWEKNAAILIAVKIPKCPRTFYMQFDLGAPNSILYKNKIDAIKAKYPTAIPGYEVDGKIVGFSFKAGNKDILAKEIAVAAFDSEEPNHMNNAAIEIIGTIGADLIDGKVAVIDYPRCKLTLSEIIPQKWTQHIKLTDFTYTNRRILLPAKIKGKETTLYFDTGSSMFELITDKETCHQLNTPGTKPTQYKIESWGKFLTANTFVSNQSIDFGNITITLKSVTYIEGVENSQIELMRKIGIGGMTGNKLFLQYVLILDTRSRKFGLGLST